MQVLLATVSMAPKGFKRLQICQTPPWVKSTAGTSKKDGLEDDVPFQLYRLIFSFHVNIPGCYLDLWPWNFYDAGWS